MRHRTAQFIGGKWVASTSAETIDVAEAATGRTLGSTPAGTAEDVSAAVAAARAAAGGWSSTPVAERCAIVSALAAGLGERAGEITEVVAREVGTPVAVGQMLQAGWPIATFAGMSTIADTLADEKLDNSVIVRDPVGVVAAIVPWNFPLTLAALKVAPALAAGCTVILKPSELAPESNFILAEVIEAAGLPQGVFNLVAGSGPVVGEALVGHPDVDMVTFTGSTATGRRVAELAAPMVKRVALELGGKSANVLLDDAPFETAVPDGVMKAFINAGQTCAALTRMLVPRSRLAEAEEAAAAAAEAIVVGNPLDTGTALGPLVSDGQRQRVLRYIEAGEREGATILTGGAKPPAGLEEGYYVRPTVFTGVKSSMTIAREEIFGPVLCLIPYDGGDDGAVAEANDSPYGLYGSVWSGDPARAEAVARRLDTGQVEVNGGELNFAAPFGGHKQSGNGHREWGRYGLEEYVELKALHL